MKYIVEVQPPVPENLDEVATKVASAFHISDDKALTLLRRAPGPVTRPVSEREARLVAGIFERAGLQVVTVREQPAVEQPAVEQPAVEQPAVDEPAVGEPAVEDAVAEEPGVEEPVLERPGVEERPVEEPLGAAMEDGPREDAGIETDGAHTDRAELGGGELGGAELDGAEMERRAWEAPGSERPEWEDPEWEGAETPMPGMAGAGTGSVVAGGATAAGAGAVAVEDSVMEDSVMEDRTEGERTTEDGADAGPSADEGPSAGEDRSAEGEAISGAAARAHRTGTPETARVSQTPETARRSAVPEMAPRTLGGSTATLSRGGLRRRVALSATLPTVLAAVVMLAAAAVTLLPVVRQRQADAAASVASAVAASVEGLDGGLPLTSPIVQAMLGDVARRSQASLPARGVRFLAITDASGIPLVSWNGAGSGALPPDVSAAVNDAALRAGEAPAAPAEGWGESLGRSWSTVQALLGFGAEPPLVAASPIRGAGGSVLGAVVVGVRPAAADGALGNAFLIILLVGLVPVLIAVLVALALTRSLTASVAYLLEAADRISRGDLEHPVDLPRNDELGQLARAIERMRVSLQEGLERLRRRR